MIARSLDWLGSVGRAFSRAEWLVRLLKMRRSPEAACQPGIVLIQVDGLSHRQLRRALARGRLPFLRRLLRREAYRLLPLYSGLPSSTPAVQGELFYGVPTAVPAFSFRDRTTGRVVRMYDAEAARMREAMLAQAGPGLLEGGSAWCDIYSGGAHEPHFCATTLGWGEFLRTLNPLAWLTLAIFQGGSVLRLGALLAVEFVLAVRDCLAGLFEKQDLWPELKFVAARVAVCIGLRELATLGAVLDVTRGLPVVHVNFLGYDEQAHRRGPSSAFAHWTLRGIDQCIRRIAKAAFRSACRDYEVWIYSDHGQEDCRPYERVSGRTLEEAVRAALACAMPDADLPPQAAPSPRGVLGARPSRATWLGGRRLQRLFPRPWASTADDHRPIVAAMGPVAHVYPPDNMPRAACEAAARYLAEQAHVPLVLAAAEPGRARAWTRQGCYSLPEDAPAILGPAHPYLHAAAQDLVRLSHHPESGRLVLIGWCYKQPAVSFPNENGAHAGPGQEECRGFLLLPRDVPLGPARPLRPATLRAAAAHRLGRGPHPWGQMPRPPRPRATLRVMTYNVHGCLGMDGKLSPARIARVIAQADPDIVALQELDVGRRRSDQVDQAHEIAQLLQMEYHFHPALTVESEQYGDAVLSRYPLRVVRAAGLPTLENRRTPLEPRGALWVAIDGPQGEVQVFNTHLGLRRRERRAQALSLLDSQWLGHPDCREPLLLLGDFNALPSSDVYRLLTGRLRDAQTALAGHKPRGTWFGRVPWGRIDHVFLGGDWEVVSIDVPRSLLARIASDHLPLVVELRLRSRG
jgi:endonuclease/exonuclease/phosphatase family metal-dependent hydrolase